MSILDETEESKFGVLLGKIRVFAPKMYVPAIIVLVGASSFALGRLSAFSRNTPVIIRGEDSQMMASGQVAGFGLGKEESPIAVQEVSSGKEVVASKNGSVYYLPWCSQVSRIKSENLVTFGSPELARKAGYKPSTACKGVE